MLSSNNSYLSEAAIKYFLIQALGSSLIIFRRSLLLFHPSISLVIIISALLLKLGAAPFHFWFPQIIESLLWPQLIILITIQKIAPLSLIALLSTYDQTHITIIMAALLSAVVGSVTGINQTSLRKIIAFSSINHIAWILTAVIIRETIIFTYFLFYCAISRSVALIFNKNQSFYIRQLLNKGKNSNLLNLPPMVALLSLGGLPPFTGFIPKWFIIQELRSSGILFLLIVLLSCTLITLYFYVRIATPFLTFDAPKFKYIAISHYKRKSSLLAPVLSYLNLFGLIIPRMFILV